MEESNNQAQKRASARRRLLGLILGGAIASVVGITLAHKDVREKIREQLLRKSSTLKDILEHPENLGAPKKKKNLFWRFIGFVSGSRD